MTRRKDTSPHFIYKLLDPRGEDNVKYIGQTIYTLKKRLGEHLRANGNSERQIWIRSLLSEGITPIIEHIETVPVGGKWWEREKYWIKWYRDMGYKLVNSTDGGEGMPGYITKKETKEKQRRAKLGTKRTAESVEKSRMSNTGKKRSLEVRKKMSEAQRGKVLSEETKGKLRQINLGKKQSEESIEKTRRANLGRRRTEQEKEALRKANLGKKMSPESIEKTRQAHMKPVAQYTLEGNLVNKYESSVTASLVLGINRRCISNCANKNGYLAGGFQWRYWDETLGADIEPYVNPRMIPVSQYTLDGVFIKEWESAATAGKELGVHASDIRTCAKGGRKTAGGFIWKYVLK
jgi:group I intron endonuclease